MCKKNLSCVFYINCLKLRVSIEALTDSLIFGVFPFEYEMFQNLKHLKNSNCGFQVLQQISVRTETKKKTKFNYKNCSRSNICVRIFIFRCYAIAIKNEQKQWIKVSDNHVRWGQWFVFSDMYNMPIGLTVLCYWLATPHGNDSNRFFLRFFAFCPILRVLITIQNMYYLFWIWAFLYRISCMHCPVRPHE